MIGRRGFLGALACMPIAAVVQPRVITPSTIEALGLRNAKARVFLNGVDVTAYAVLVTQVGQRGYIEFLARDRTGAVHAINGELPRTRLHGGRKRSGCLTGIDA